jgi:putative spermidine/putrescine transport system permease protein
VRPRAAGAALLAPVTLILAGLFVAPVLLMVPISFHPYEAGRGIKAGWTLENYAQILTDEYYREVVLRTLGLGLAVTGLCILLGYPLAFFLARTRSRWRTLLVLLVIFPMLLNLVVRSYGWIALLANRGLINTTLIDLGVISAPLRLIFNFTGLVIGLTHIYLPFMVLMIMASVQNVPREVEHAAATLGASRPVVFATVTLPLTAPGVLAGSILVFVLTVSALVTPRMLGGATYKVMATLIYDEFMQVLDWPSGSALAFLLTALVLAVIGAAATLAERVGRTA